MVRRMRKPTMPPRMAPMRTARLSFSFVLEPAEGAGAVASPPNEVRVIVTVEEVLGGVEVGGIDDVELVVEEVVEDEVELGGTDDVLGGGRVAVTNAFGRATLMPQGPLPNRASAVALGHNESSVAGSSKFGTGWTLERHVPSEIIKTCVASEWVIRIATSTAAGFATVPGSGTFVPRTAKTVGPGLSAIR
jgi:hypothetical protein